MEENLTNKFEQWQKVGGYLCLWIIKSEEKFEPRELFHYFIKQTESEKFCPEKPNSID